MSHYGAPSSTLFAENTDLFSIALVDFELEFLEDLVKLVAVFSAKHGKVDPPLTQTLVHLLRQHPDNGRASSQERERHADVGRFPPGVITRNAQGTRRLCRGCRTALGRGG